MVSLAPVSVIKSNTHCMRRVRGSRTPDTRIIVQKSEEATASMLATPMLMITMPTHADNYNARLVHTLAVLTTKAVDSIQIQGV